MALWIVLGYFILILLISRVFARRIQDRADFYLANRELSALPIALCFVASWFGAGSTMGSLDAFHQDGLSAAWKLAIPSFLSCVVISALIAKRVSRLGIMSQPEAVERHYGRAGRFLLSLIILASTTTFVGSQMVAAGRFFEGVLGLDPALAILLTTTIVLSYSILGGFFAVVVTDVMQFLLMISGLGLLALFTLGHFLDPATGSQLALQGAPSAFWQWTSNLPEHIALTFTFVLAWSIAPEMWQRMTACKDPATAQKSAWWATSALCGLWCIISFTGLACGLLYPQWGGAEGGANVLITAANNLPHPIWTAWVYVGFLAAVMSTMDSSINVGSLTLAHDLYGGYLRPKANEKEMVWASRLALVVVATPAMAIAIHIQDILKVLWMSADIYASAMAIPVLGLLFLKEPSPRAGVWAMVTGGTLALYSSGIQYGWWAPPGTWFPIAPYSTLVGIGASALAFGIGQWVHQRTEGQELAPQSVGPDETPCPA